MGRAAIVLNPGLMILFMPGQGYGWFIKAYIGLLEFSKGGQVLLMRRSLKAF